MKQMRVLFILVCLFFQTNADRYALLIGSNSGGRGVEKLQYAHDDARRFSRILIELGGFDSSHIHTLYEPDIDGIESSFSEILGQMKSAHKPGSLFLFYYSGHATEDELLTGEARLASDRLRTLLSSVPARVQVAVIDACHSGSMVRFKGGKLSKALIVDRLRDVEGQVVIAAGAPGEPAQESDALKSSVFSFHWINGLRGSADFSGDGKVSLNEAYQYAYRKTVETTALSGPSIQHPSYGFKIHGRGDVMLTDIRETGSGILFPDTLQGSFLVIDENNADIIADFLKKEGRDICIGVGPGQYTVVRRIPKPAKAARVTVTTGELLSIDERSLVEDIELTGMIKGYIRQYGGAYRNGSNNDGSSKMGIGVKFGEGTGAIGLVVSYNFNETFQVQLGKGMGGVKRIPDTTYAGIDYRRSFSSEFAAAKLYWRFVYAGVGLSRRTLSVDLTDIYGSREVEKTSYTIPVFTGIEYGQRNRLYVGASAGWAFAVYGAGRGVSVRGSDGKDRIIAQSVGSGFRIGLSIGYYFL